MYDWRTEPLERNAEIRTSNIDKKSNTGEEPVRLCNYMDVDVHELGHRWASCSPAGRLAFHWKCMMTPQTIVDVLTMKKFRIRSLRSFRGWPQQE